MATAEATSSRSTRRCRRGLVQLAVFAAILPTVAGCSAGSESGSNGPDPSAARLSITPAGGKLDTRPERGITVRAERGRITDVAARVEGEPVPGELNATKTVWHSSWALNVSSRFIVTATAVGKSGEPVTRKSRFRTLRPAKTFSTQIIEGYRQTYGIGMPIILYFSRPIANKAAVERALEIRTSRRVVGAWHWDGSCNLAAVCLYYRPRHYWPPHTRISFTGHLDGVAGSPGVYGDHTLTQRFAIGSPLTVMVDTAGHHMDVHRNGKLFAHWPISTGRPGDETPNGTYLTIEKANPVDMIGPGYNIEVPWSVRFTWSGDYLHDAYWSVGEQGFTNVSHGCVNMSPEDAEIFYEMADPGDPVEVTGSPRAGVWDNGWTMWFLSWKKWMDGSAIGKPVLSGPGGSRFVNPSSLVPHRQQPRRGSGEATAGSA
jgi:lipoprotein-anchoring transpeptidase ErfK/SrfK